MTTILDAAERGKSIINNDSEKTPEQWVFDVPPSSQADAAAYLAVYGDTINIRLYGHQVYNRLTYKDRPSFPWVLIIGLSMLFAFNIRKILF